MNNMRTLINIMHEIISWDGKNLLSLAETYNRLSSFKDVFQFSNDKVLATKWRFFLLKIFTESKKNGIVSTDTLESIQENAKEILKHPFFLKHIKEYFKMFCIDLLKNLSQEDFSKDLEKVNVWQKKAEEMLQYLKIQNNQNLQKEIKGCNIICHVFYLRKNQSENADGLYHIIESCIEKFGYVKKKESIKFEQHFKNLEEADIYLNDICEKLGSSTFVCPFNELKDIYQNLIEIYKQFSENNPKVKDYCFLLGTAIEKALEVKDETEYLNLYPKSGILIQEMTQKILQNKNKENSKNDLQDSKAKNKEIPPLEENIFIDFYEMGQGFLYEIKNKENINLTVLKDYFKQIIQMQFFLKKQFANSYVNQMLKDLKTMKESLKNYMSIFLSSEKEENSLAKMELEDKLEKNRKLIESAIEPHVIYRDIFTTYYTILNAVKNHSKYNTIYSDLIKFWIEKLQTCEENIKSVPLSFINEPNIREIKEMLRIFSKDLEYFNGIEDSKLNRLEQMLSSYLNKNFYSTELKEYSYYDFCNDFSKVQLDTLSEEQIQNWQVKLKTIISSYKYFPDTESQRIYSDAKKVYFLLDDMLRNSSYGIGQFSFDFQQIKEINLYHKTINDFYEIIEEMVDLVLEEDGQDLSLLSTWIDKMIVIYKDLKYMNKKELEDMQRDAAQLLVQFQTIQENKPYNLNLLKEIASAYISVEENVVSVSNNYPNDLEMNPNPVSKLSFKEKTIQILSSAKTFIGNFFPQSLWNKKQDVEEEERKIL